ncbi:hypothetical protein BDF19DRAFT_421093 [Syncephalis fuscata]|nr:hypothetical protein BDF19DRAFT_421093 [Syncephalis fuscata]
MESDDEYFYTYYGITKTAVNIFAGFYIAICAGHIGFCVYRKSWAHGAYSFAYLLAGIINFIISHDNVIGFLSASFCLMYMGSLTWLTIQWTHVMRPSMHTSANTINALSHFIMVVIVIRAILSLAISIRTALEENSPEELYLAANFLHFPCCSIMLLLSIWGFFACPKEAQYTGCDIKRWQIGMLAIMWFAILLQLTFGYFIETIYGYYIMLIIIGCIPFYPRHTLNGHSIPPGKENTLSGSSVMMTALAP